MRNTGKKIQGKTKHSEKKCLNGTLSHKYPTLNGSGSNSDLRSDKTTANRLFYGADNIHSVFSVPTSHITICDSIKQAILLTLFRRLIATISNNHKKAFSILCEQNLKTRVILNKCVYSPC